MSQLSHISFPPERHPRAPCIGRPGQVGCAPPQCATHRVPSPAACKGLPEPPGRLASRMACQPTLKFCLGTRIRKLSFVVVLPKTSPGRVRSRELCCGDSDPWPSVNVQSRLGLWCWVRCQPAVPGPCLGGMRTLCCAFQLSCSPSCVLGQAWWTSPCSSSESLPIPWSHIIYDQGG